MASAYTCRACSRALLKQSVLANRKIIIRRESKPFSTTAQVLYHGSKSLNADDRPEAIKKPRPNIKIVKPVKMSLAEKIREKAPLLTETYVAYGATRELMKACSQPGEYKIPQALEKNGEIPTDENGVHIGEGEGWWYDTLGLKPTFSNWAQITFVHMYMLQVRFRMFPKTHADEWIQHLTNHAFYAAEDRLVVYHKFNANSLRQKHLKDMFSQWRGVLLSYDEGLMKGDAMFAAAIWRNLLGARDDVDFEKLAQIVAYMRKELKRLEEAKDDDVASGAWKFGGNPGEEANLVKVPSRMMAREATKS